MFFFGNKLYVIGGKSMTSYDVIKNMEVFDFVRKEWETVELNREVCLGAAVVWDGRIVVCGGADKKGYTGNVYYFDPDNLTWTQLPSFNEPYAIRAFVNQ